MQLYTVTFKPQLQSFNENANTLITERCLPAGLTLSWTLSIFIVTNLTHETVTTREETPVSVGTVHTSYINVQNEVYILCKTSNSIITHYQIFKLDSNWFQSKLRTRSMFVHICTEGIFIRKYSRSVSYLHLLAYFDSLTETLNLINHILVYSNHIPGLT